MPLNTWSHRSMGDWVMRMALFGQISWQQLQLIQRCTSRTGTDALAGKVSAWTGQAFTHRPQRTQAAGEKAGRTQTMRPARRTSHSGNKLSKWPPVGTSNDGTEILSPIGAEAAA